ncbi:hypothetical protein [Anabaena lutea]|uniref:AsmA domain-containing protein n=1 Tax=Anabaena lutea FACHB-196 TaxID=2692881 RepID=A0ABR8FMG7_9NOST|nr:hypothetical protein [Anabaena lutea]MBD2571363.1 hypothetical protein [Anabaena lutea FACHB-196]
MVKKSRIIGGFVIAGVVLGVLAIGGNILINQYAQKEVEQGLSDGTGLKVDCAEANVNLFAQSLKMMDIRFSNLAGFPSPYIFKIGSIEVQAERLNAKPLNFEMMIIKDVEINIDGKFSNNPAQPQNMIHINVQEMQQKANNGGSTKKSSTSQPELIIQQMRFQNIQVNINAQLPLQSNPVKEQFQIQEISLSDLTNENLPKKLSTALQEQILMEVKNHLNQKNTPQLNQILEPLMGLRQKNSSPLSLPKKLSLPSPSQQPKPPSPPQLPARPSFP